MLVDALPTPSAMISRAGRAASGNSAPAGGRERWLRLYPITLGVGGLAGAWRTAVGLGAPTWPAVYLAAACFGGWLAITAMYVRHGGARPFAFVADLRHPDQGFAMGYLPVIPLLLLAQPRARMTGVRILDLALVAGWALATAALVAHWLTNPRDRHTIHPGCALPVVAGPYISCISLQANGWHQLALGLFAVGVFFWLTFGTVIVGRLMTEQRLPDARFPTMAALMVPPATGSVAWFGLHDNRATTVGIGLAAVLAMLALVQLFIVPEYLRRPFTMSAWSFSFPVAASANTVGHWAVAVPNHAGHVLAWLILVAATMVIGLLAALSARRVWQSRRAAGYRRFMMTMRKGARYDSRYGH
jgi:tellurite resistance protein